MEGDPEEEEIVPEDMLNKVEIRMRSNSSS